MMYIKNKKFEVLHLKKLTFGKHPFLGGPPRIYNFRAKFKIDFNRIHLS